MLIARKTIPDMTPKTSSSSDFLELEAVVSTPSSNRYDPIQSPSQRKQSGHISFLEWQHQVRLQILPEPAGKDLSRRDDANGFAYIGIWLMSEKMFTDMTLAVEQGET
jgi:hypothetical protein